MRAVGASTHTHVCARGNDDCLNCYILRWFSVIVQCATSTLPVHSQCIARWPRTPVRLLLFVQPRCDASRRNVSTGATLVLSSFPPTYPLCRSPANGNFVFVSCIVCVSLCWVVVDDFAPSQCRILLRTMASSSAAAVVAVVVVQLQKHCSPRYWW